MPSTESPGGPRRTPRTARPEPACRAVRLGYLAAGLVMSGMWLRGADLPAWEHALRVLVVVLVVPPLVHLVRRRRERRADTVRSPRVPLRRLVALKVALVAAALCGERLLLRIGLPGADAITAAALLLTVSLAGPPFHQRQLSPAPPGRHEHGPSPVPKEM
ncbi:hypothetical protein [Streptomyces sp. NPDC001828]|uniref:hypothetical protein n=1 Tax=Streptomyces sp. NPDC001828 TaxID=3364615 RepID=UPI0036858B38